MSGPGRFLKLPLKHVGGGVIDGADGKVSAITYGTVGGHVVEEADDNADAIVRAVNSREELLELVRETAGVLAIFSRPGKGLPPIAEKLADEIQATLRKIEDTT